MNFLEIITQTIIPLLPVLAFFIHTCIENTITHKFSFKRNILYIGIYGIISIILNFIFIPNYLWWGLLIQIGLSIVFFFLIVSIIGNKVSGATINTWLALLILIPYPNLLLIGGITIGVMLIVSIIQIGNKTEVEYLANQAMVNKLDYSYLPDHKEAVEEKTKKIFVPNITLLGLIIAIVANIIYLVIF